jgi:anti-anti-sigma factor
MSSLACSPDVAVSHRDATPLISRDGDRTVVWLRGEHDIATAPVLADSLATATATSGCDVIVDLRRVTILDAATIGVLVRARNTLRGNARDLTLRAPSGRANHVLDLCGLLGLVEPGGRTTGEP